MKESGPLKGVVLIACGNVMYGNYALNLCLGIKQADSNVNITLIYSGNALNQIQLYLHNFDKIIQIPDECIKSNGFESLLRSKVCLYDITPYDTTIFIDSDCMWFPNKRINDLFEELKDIDFTIGNRSKNDLSTDPRLIWCKSEELIRVYGEVNIYNLSSEFIYFKKCDKVAEYFEYVKDSFDFPEVEYNRFGGTVPDELAFQIAMIKTEMEPHKTPYLVGYWEPYEKKQLNLSELYKTDKWFYSIGGNIMDPQMRLNYDTLAKIYATGFGIKYPFLSKNKRDVLLNRKNI
jgi:hypothetical protein